MLRAVPGLIALAILLLAPPALAQSESRGVTLDVIDFGVGNRVRPGGWVGIRLRLTDTSTRPRELLVRVSGWDPDGDRPFYEQVVPAGDGSSRDVWMYVKIPYGFGPSATLDARVYEAVATDDPARPYRPGDTPLFQSLISPSVPSQGGGSAQVIAAEDGLIGIVGRGQLGLNDYAQTSGNESWPPLAHERVEIVTQLAPTDLPDRWIGLSPFEVLVWTDADPSALGTERPRALIEWIRRGGHLVVVLPPIGQAWTTPRSNPLFDILPHVSVSRRESLTDTGPLFPLLSSRRPPADAPDIVIHDLTPLPNANWRNAYPVLTDPDRNVIVARRLEGLGMVTLVGLDLASPALRSQPPRADRFWNRVLGKRGEYPTSADLNAPGVIHDFPTRRPYWFDQDIASIVAKQGRSAAGLFAGFFVFALYWLIAGPLGYTILKRMGWHRHAWVAYVASAAAFTLIAWGIAITIRPKRVDGNHLTFIDHVYEQPYQRTRTWMSLLIPSYGDASLVVDGGEDLPDARFHNLVAPWQNRRMEGRATGFPDARDYPVDGRDPSHPLFPTRATVKQFVVDWAGLPRDGWGMPTPILAPGETGIPALTLVRDADGIFNGEVKGILTHDLPAPLTDVLLIINPGQREISPQVGPRAMPPARAYKLAGTLASWEPTERLDLAQLTADSPVSTLEAYLDNLVPPARSGLSFQADDEDLSGDPTARLTALALYPFLRPVTSTTSAQEQPLVRRWDTHTLDLGKWLTQPCIIIIGHMRQDSPSPTPLTITDGGEPRTFRTRGHTVVRWVYPLPPHPPTWARPDTFGPTPPESTDPDNWQDVPPPRGR